MIAKSYITSQNPKEKVNASFAKQIQHRVEGLALLLSKYSASAWNEIELNKQSDIDELFIQYPTLHTRDKVLGFRFIHKPLQEFLVAKQIRQEIAAILENPNATVPKTLLLNQHLLKNQQIILQFLGDAIKDSTIKTETFLKFIELSKHNGSNEKLGDLFSDIATNSMMMLNNAGFDFSNMDLRGISIPSANLSHGIFEQTNFLGSNLTGVNFTGSNLSHATLSKASKTNVKFGMVPWIELKKLTGALCYSPNGELITGAGNEIIIFKKVLSSTGLFYREIRRFEAHDQDHLHTFSLNCNGKHLATAFDRTVHIWELESGKCLTKFECDFSEEIGAGMGIELCLWSPTDPNMLLITSEISDVDYPREFQIRDITTGEITFEDSCCLEEIGFGSNGKEVHIVSDRCVSDHTFNAYDINTGSLLYTRDIDEDIDDRILSTSISKLHHKNIQMVSGKKKNTYIHDYIRSHFIKSFDSSCGYKKDSNPDRYWKDTMCPDRKYYSFNADGNLMISKFENDVIIQDIANGKLTNLFEGYHHGQLALHPNGKEITMVDHRPGYCSLSKDKTCKQSSVE